MYKELLILLTCLLFLHASPAQKTTRIEGVLNNIEDDKVTIYPDYDGFLNEHHGIDCPVKNHRFSFSYVTAHSGFVRIESKTFPWRLLFVQPGDTLALSADQTAGKLRCTVEGGRDPLGNTLFLKGRFAITNWIELSQNLIPQIAGLTDVDSAFFIIQRHTDSSKLAIDSLYRANGLSDAMYRALTAYQESYIVFTCCDYLRITKYLVERDSLVPPLHFDVAGCKQLMRLILTTWDPFDDKYFSSFTESSNLTFKGELIRSHDLPVQNPGEKILWAKDHKSFIQTMSHEAPFPIDSGFWMLEHGITECPHAYVTGVSQQLIQSHHILGDLTWSNDPPDVIAQQIALYIQRYPHSEINPFFQSEIKRLESGNTTLENYGHFGVYDTAKDSLILTTVPTLDFKNIKEIVSTQFSNRAVLIDCWATWCPPCMEELKYADTLFTLLKKKNIGLLFISFDKQANKLNWAKTVNRLKLKGTHYIASDDFGAALRAELNVNVLAIPRFLLVDKKGDILIPSTVLPSDLNGLDKQIDKFLVCAAN